MQSTGDHLHTLPRVYVARAISKDESIGVHYGFFVHTILYEQPVSMKVYDEGTMAA